MRLSRDGVLLTGILQNASGKWHSGKTNYYEVRLVYTFSDPKTNQTIAPKAILTRDDLRNVPLPTPGTPLYVIFLDKNNYQLL